MEKIHYFHIAVSKNLFHHPERGLVAVYDPIKLAQAAKYDLSPFLLYSLSPPGIPFYWLAFSTIPQPLILKEVLYTGWSEGEGLRGQPDILIVGPDLFNSAPSLKDDMAKIGVNLKIVEKGDRLFHSSLLTAQKATQNILFMRNIKIDPLQTDAAKTLCKIAQIDHECVSQRDSWGSLDSKVKERIREWRTFPYREPTPVKKGPLDWQPGPWTLAWEKRVTHSPPRFFNYEKFSHITWLYSGVDYEAEDYNGSFIDDDES
ncbi:MAG: hypothetical protein LBV23_04090 [Deltaproteobacteria bacterium]|jgi:hypothetical protein|nr:hypothetical protein [Deltaproteobacteria bacterium]